VFDLAKTACGFLNKTGNQIGTERDMDGNILIGGHLIGREQRGRRVGCRGADAAVAAGADR
jgi:hypothetical protein